MTSRKLFLSKQSNNRLSNSEQSGDSDSITSELFNLETLVKSREIKYPRASSIYDCCIRLHVLATLYGIEKTERIHLNRRVTFDIGNAIHYWFQNDPSYLGDQRVGNWECRACGFTTKFGKPVTNKCRACGASHKAFVYKEIDLVLHKPYPITGHPDMFIEPRTNPNVIRVMEFKTINGERFETLSAPLISHVWQLQTYIWMINEDDTLLPVPVDKDYGYIVYISKKEKFGQLPIKTFVVRKDRDLIRRVRVKLQHYVDGVKGRSLPDPLGKCVSSNFTDYVSNSCPVVSVCKKEYNLKRSQKST